MKPSTWLGWVSMVIGAAEVLAPRKIMSMLGIERRPRRERLTRLLGGRELLHGASLLSGRSARGTRQALWGRVAGDVLDTAVLARAAFKTRRPMRFALCSAAVLGIGALDLYAATRARTLGHKRRHQGF